MFDKTKLQEVISDYKKDFISTQWPREKFKWEAVKNFQDNWDIDAEDFPEMLERSLNKTGNLLHFRNHFPRKMIIEMAQFRPEKVRSMFKNLFDEERDVYDRISEFKSQSQELVKVYKEGKSDFQDENSISVYLWLRYPDKYYIYRISELKKAVDKLDADYQFINAHYKDNINNFLKFYNEINEELKKDKELKKLLQSQLTNEFYQDEELKALTSDLGFYIKNKYQDKENEYNPGLTIDNWKELLTNKEVFTDRALEMLQQIKECGNEATCTQLENKYGKTKNYYISESANLAKRVCKAKGITPKNKSDGTPEWWPVLFTGRYAQKSEEGSFVWKLREELSKALDFVNEENNELNKSTETETSEQSYWWLNANPGQWSFSNIAVGETQNYTLYNENGNQRRIFQNFLDAKEGDRVIGYESSPKKEIVVLGKINAAPNDQEIVFEKTEGLISPISYHELKDLPELKEMEFSQNNNRGTLFKLTKDQYDFLMDIIREENPNQDEKSPIQVKESYTKDDFLNEVYLDETQYKRLSGLLKYHKNIILSGAPGVGKTFTSRRLAWSLMGEKDNSRIEFIQFHQNYSYEDFMMGIKPFEDTYKLQNGVFYRFCQKASNNPEKDYFFIIDEINRGNLSKIFGELLMLIDKDYRGTKVTLAYSGESFTIPDNLYIIGMMNTADRSLALIDYALGRRFSKFPMYPGFDSEGFRAYQKKLNNKTFDELILKIKDLNREIESDSSLGKGFCIAHSYFCDCEEATDDKLQLIIDYEILPMLEEYWFDEPGKFEHWKRMLQGVFK